MTIWNVLRVVVGSETDASVRALAGGADVYCPTYLTRTRNRRGHRGQKVDAEHPMFPGYIFASFAGLEAVNEDFSAPEFARSCSAGRQRVSVVVGKRLSDAQIGAVRALAFKMTSVGDKTVIRPGVFVDVWRGLMRGERAEIIKVRGERALISLLGGHTQPIEVDITDLESVSREPYAVAI